MRSSIVLCCSCTCGGRGLDGVLHSVLDVSSLRFWSALLRDWLVGDWCRECRTVRYGDRVLLLLWGSFGRINSFLLGLSNFGRRCSTPLGE